MQPRKGGFGNLQKRCSDAASLRLRKYVKLVDPLFPKCDNSNQRGIFKCTPNLANPVQLSIKVGQTEKT